VGDTADGVQSLLVKEKAMSNLRRWNRVDGRLAEDPIGYDVVMKYRGNELLGRICDKYDLGGEEWLSVKFFNGDQWPLDPMAGEVSVLTR